MSVVLPADACDSHCHVFGPQARFPFDPKRTYTPADAPKEALMALHQKLGFKHAVVLQGACHGFDNSAVLDVIAAAQGRYRGIALVPEDISAGELARLHDGGIRGVRFNFVPHLGPPPPEKTFRRIADAVAPFGWHIVLHIAAEAIDIAVPYLAPLEMDFVVDHMARVSAAGGVQQRPFQRLLELVRDPRCWVKISAADRASATGAPYADAAPFMAALVEASPTRTLWGTDWPHPNVKGPTPREEDLLALLFSVVSDEIQRRRILVENPARLYGFTPS